MTEERVGILGIGVYLPDEIRRNDWWPADLVERWKQRAASAGGGSLRGASEASSDDPFGGAVERRVMPAGMETSDMEIAAAREALAAASIEPSEVDLLLVSSWMPDFLATNSACTVHAGLGLPTASFSLSVESASNAFHHQLTIAESLIATGRARYGLLVQSCSISRVLPYDQPYSAWLGDGAAAIVVGPVGGDFGVLGSAHRTDGTLQLALVAGVPGGRWFDEGRSILYSERPDRVGRTLAGVRDCARDAVTAALADAGLRAEDVNFYACHQGKDWMPRVTMAYAGLSNARTLDTFSKTASLSAANIPVVLAEAQEQGLLQPGDVVVTHAGGGGATWSSCVLRWGS